MSQEIVKVRITTLRSMKEAGKKIAMVTAYDAITGRWADQAGVEVVLVGDSLGNNVLGFPTTIEVTLEMMIHHCAAVARGVTRALRVGDMPFMSYKISPEQAMANCARLIQEGAMEAVKLEGGAEIVPMVERLVRAGVPVMGHVGLLPQSYHAQGGYRIQGRDEAAAQRLLGDAHRLEEAGVFSIVLEGIPSSLAAQVTRELKIPTIGIGAGRECDGQVLVMADLLGVSGRPLPKLARAYANFHEEATQAIRRYADDVREGNFPGPENTYGE
jgi:3-methyl-2-oxobutanoate hydroxymethyltransferase